MRGDGAGGTGPAGGRSAVCGPGGAAHDIERRLAAGPQLEAEGALRDEDLQTVDGVRSARRGGGKQRGG